MWNGIYNTMKPLLDAFKYLFETIWQAIQILIGSALTAIQTKITSIWNAIVAFVTPMLTGLQTTFSTVWSAIQTAISTVLTAIQTAVTTVWNAIVSFLSPLLTGIQTRMSTAWNAIKTVISTVLSAIQSTVSSIWNAISSKIYGVVNGIKSVVSSGWNAMKSTVSSLSNSIKSAATTAFNSMKSGISSTISGIKNTITNGFNSAVSFIKGLAGQAWGSDMIGNNFSVPDEGPLADMESWMPDFMQGLANGITTNTSLVTAAAENLSTTLSTSITNSMRGVEQAYSKSWAAISQTVKTGTAGVSAAMRSAWSSITTSTASTWNTIKSSIGVYFEKENIDTLDASGELLLTILSALAQEESNSISKNISWSIQKRFQEGIAFGNPRSVYGYTDGETNKDWVIVEEQAKVVRFIFDEFLLGKSSYKISNELNEKGIPSSKGTKWQSESVDFILRNEKYVGDCEMQKTVTVDFLSHKTIPNNGEAPKFYVTDHHVPIINRAVWMRAQEILAHRKKNRTKKKDEKREKRVGKDVFDNLVCGKCGAPFYRRTLQARATHFEDDRCLDACRSELLAQGSSPDDYYERYYYTYPVWRCSSLKDTSPTNDGSFMGKADPDVAWHPIYIGEGDAKCPSHFVYETAVKQSFMEMLYAIKRDHEENGENAWIDSEFRMVYQKVQEHVAERDSSRKTELDEQILQLDPDGAGGRECNERVSAADAGERSI